MSTDNAVVLTGCAAFIGLDWADRKHDICIKDAADGKLQWGVLAHNPKAIKAWVNSLRDRFGGRAVAICLEQKRGPIIYALAQYDFLVLAPVSPQTLARFRRTFKVSRAKDDPTDAALMVDLLERHPDKLRIWQPEEPQIRRLQLLVEMRRTAVADRVRITNRLTSALKQYYPQILDWFRDHDTRVFAEFLLHWPELQKAKRARKTTLRQFFKDHNSRYGAVIDKRIEEIKQATPLHEDRALIESFSLRVTSLAHQLKLAIADIDLCEQRISSCFESLPDAGLFAGLPGAGPALAPRLLAAFGQDRNRWPEVNAFLQYTGIAPVTERSGMKHWVHFRYSCPKFLRQTFIEWAAQTIRVSFWAKRFYELQREKGKTHQMAIRALAFKWIRILHRCWLDRKPYDESKYLMALQAKGSPLLAGLPSV